MSDEREGYGWCGHGVNLDEGLCPVCDLVEIALSSKHSATEEEA